MAETKNGDVIDRIVATDKSLTIRIQNDRGTTEQYTFPWDFKYPKLEKALAVLEQAVWAEVRKGR